jgi:hypothetical protein
MTTRTTLPTSSAAWVPSSLRSVQFMTAGVPARSPPPWPWVAACVLGARTCDAGTVVHADRLR